MKSRTLLSVAAVLFAVLAFAGRSAAQGNQDHTHQHHHYSLIDMGTFGGPQSYNYGEDAQSLNNRGTVVGQADTPIPDPNYPNVNPLVDLFPDPFIQHSFKWQRGIRTDLGALPGVNSSVVSWMNDKGVAVGISTTGSIDPITGWPAAVAVAWNNGQITNLGTLGGNESLATAINDRGEIVGVSANTTLDLNSLFGLGTQTRAFLWQGGVMRDIGTLGGTDAAPLLINNRGQVAGFSYTSSLALDPFLWDNGSMIDLGSLGGTFGVPQWLSRRGRVVGKMTLVGDLTNHPFLWDQGVLRDLGTLGGDNGNALWVNDDGVVVGQADVVGSQEHHAFLWTQGVMNDLGTLDGDSCSVAWAINSKGQVVGTSDQCIAAPRAFLWERGQIIDLNVFVPPGSDLTLVEPHYINERGEITGNAVLSNGDLRAFLLIPCDEGHPDIKSCDYSLVNTTTAASRPSPMVGDVSSRTLQLGMRPGYRRHFPGAAVRPIN